MNKTSPKIQVLSVGKYLPNEVVKSDDLFAEFGSDNQYGIPVDWMSQEMGIVERRMATEDAKPSDLAVPAAREAIESSNINPDEIDLVIFCGIERDHPEPATAHIVQSKLGLAAPYAFDVANACFGFIDAMSIASKFIESGTIRYALVVTGEVPTHVLRRVLVSLKSGVTRERAKTLIGMLSVGDAGGAVILGRSEDGISGFDLITTDCESRHAKKCYYKIDENGVLDGQMMMGHLSALMINKHDKQLKDTLNQLGWAGFDWFLSHQIGKRPFERIGDFSGIRDSRKVKTFDYLGNITTATFPVNFDKMLKSGKLEKGEKVGGCFGGSGVVYGQFGYSI